MPGSVSIAVEPPRGCPAWLWRIWGAHTLDVIVGDGRFVVKWSEGVELPIDRPHTRVIVWQNGDGLHFTVKLTELDVSPGDHIRLRSSWLPGRTLVVDGQSWQAPNCDRH